MNAKFVNSVLSLSILLASATIASAQNILLFTFDDSGRRNRYHHWDF